MKNTLFAILSIAIAVSTASAVPALAKKQSGTIPPNCVLDWNGNLKCFPLPKK